MLIWAKLLEYSPSFFQIKTPIAGGASKLTIRLIKMKVLFQIVNTSAKVDVERCAIYYKRWN
ncbi:hypothetical protein SAMN05421882_101652 [Nitrosomonas communis]|uniref:Uncharacterized protein n=1 Tax=Nitrosomonas communis TaxID=44574 RepID=A0A1H2UKX3_9PROT|nr:hypothetical protein SAMN05421882_101652 [Nitrosomonas communis]